MDYSKLHWRGFVAFFHLACQQPIVLFPIPCSLPTHPVVCSQRLFQASVGLATGMGGGASAVLGYVGQGNKGHLHLLCLPLCSRFGAVLHRRMHLLLHSLVHIWFISSQHALARSFNTTADAPPPSLLFGPSLVSRPSSRAEWVSMVP